jgi:hypothetical protein
METQNSDKEMHLVEAKCEGKDLIHLIESKAHVNTTENRDKRGFLEHLSNYRLCAVVANKTDI